MAEGAASELRVMEPVLSQELQKSRGAADGWRGGCREYPGGSGLQMQIWEAPAQSKEGLPWGLQSFWGWGLHPFS